MSDAAWPPAGQRKVLGTGVPRVDAVDKVTGRARFTADVARPGMLYGMILRSPHARATVRRLDVEAAQRMPGVAALRVVQGVGSELRWALDEVVAVAADTEGQAADALRAVVVEYEVGEPFVADDALDAAPETRPGEERSEGDAAAALTTAAVRHRGFYGIAAVSHNALEPHGQVCEWDGDELTVWCSTQAVSAMPLQYAEALGIPPEKVRVIARHVGGGFGAKFSPDRWGIECAWLAREAGRPVKLMLDRAAEIAVAGHRPSLWAEVEVGADAAGRLVAWRSRSWGSGGPGGSASPPLPYVLVPPAFEQRHVSVPTDVAAARTWRALGHPQACLVTMAALDDLAAARGEDPLDFVSRHLDLTGELAGVYREELEVAAGLMEWQQRWTPRGGQAETVERRGLGLSIHTWGGRGHASTCQVTVAHDGAVEARLASQDIGTGTRTVVAVVLAETFGLPVERMRVVLGDSSLPASGASGGSSTAGGVAASTRRAALDARRQLLARLAPAVDARPEGLELVDGVVRVAGTGRELPWEEALAAVPGRLPGQPLVTAVGSSSTADELTGEGVGGVQMAAVAVDVETGVVTVEKMVAVQDCGLVVDPLTARSQVLGGLVMGISCALGEERVVDPTTGRVVNADMTSYRMAGMADVGELVVHLMSGPGYDERGVIGLGEPPVISPGAAISNAVANAVGVRVPTLPLTPRRVRDALARRGRLG